jgi:hypothetical protein
MDFQNYRDLKVSPCFFREFAAQRSLYFEARVSKMRFAS